MEAKSSAMWRKVAERQSIQLQLEETPTRRDGNVAGWPYRLNPALPRMPVVGGRTSSRCSQIDAEWPVADLGEARVCTLAMALGKIRFVWAA